MARRGLHELATLTGGAYLNLALGLSVAALTARIIGVEELGRAAVAMGFYFAAATIVESGCTQLIIADRPFSTGRGRAATVAYRRRRVRFLPFLVVASAISFAVGPDAIGLAVLTGGLGAMYDDSWALYSVARFGAAVAGETLARLVNLGAILMVLPSAPSAEAAVMTTFLGTVARLFFVRARVSRLTGRGAQPECHYDINSAAATRYLTSRLMSVAMNQMAPAIYSSSATLSAVGTYSAADRVVRAAQAGTNHYATFALPRLAHADHGGRLRRVVLQFGAGALGLGGAISLVLVLAASGITDVMYGDEFGETEEAIKLFAVLITVSIVSNYLNAAVIPVIGNTWISFNANLIALCAFIGAVLTTWEERSPSQMVLVTLVPELVFLICLAVAIGWQSLGGLRNELHD